MERGERERGTQRERKSERERETSRERESGNFSPHCSIPVSYVFHTCFIPCFFKMGPRGFWEQKHPP